MNDNRYKVTSDLAQRLDTAARVFTLQQGLDIEFTIGESPFVVLCSLFDRFTTSIDGMSRYWSSRLYERWRRKVARTLDGSNYIRKRDLFALMMAVKLYYGIMERKAKKQV